MASDTKQNTRNLGIREGLLEIKWIWVTATAAVVALIVGTPFLAEKSGQMLAGFLTTGIATLVSIYATYHASVWSSDQRAREELTRYGLLAWRNLESLQLKIAHQLQRDTTTARETLQEWNLDIDQAKWAWRDLLREVFELEERLQNETYELTQEYRSKIQAAVNPEEARKLEAEQSRQLARLISSSRLPIRIPTDVRCPYCGNVANVIIGSNPGESATTTCPSCERSFFAHRSGDGTLFTRESNRGGVPPQPKFVRPEIRLSCVRAVENVFRLADDHKMSDWRTYHERVKSELEKIGVDVHEDSGIYNWLFHLKAFRLFGPGNGIGLVVSPDQLVPFVEDRYITHLDEAIDAETLCERLYGSNRERLSALRERLAQSQCET